MKIKPNVKKICDKYEMIRRHGCVIVICKSPRHKQRRGRSSATGLPASTALPAAGQPPDRRPGLRCSAGERQYSTPSDYQGAKKLAHLSGVGLPREERAKVASAYIYGTSRTRSAEALAATDISPDIRVHDLTEDQLVALEKHIDENYKVEGDPRRGVQANTRHRIEIGCYQGLRHHRGLSAHGQRTKTNARTHKGSKRIVAGKKKK